MRQYPTLLRFWAAGLVISAAALLLSGIVGLNPLPGASAHLTVNKPLTALTVTPSTAVPNQQVVLTGTGLSLSSTAGGTGANGLHRVTGTGISFIKFNGIPMGPPRVTYPILLDSGGNLVASLVVPVNAGTLAPGAQSIEVVDDVGAKATASVTIPSRVFTITPASSFRGTMVTAKATGFPAGNPTIPGDQRVTILYGNTTVATPTPDSSGAFETTFLVPVDAGLASSNTVTVSALGGLATSTATHAVPGPSISFAPESGPPGFPTFITGINFPAFQTITSVIFGGAQVLPSPAPNPDADGKFDISVLVPQVSPGVHSVTLTAGGFSATGAFTVTAPIGPPTPTPTPTPLPVVTPSVGLAPLLSADNVVRVWNFENSTKRWTFFDPRPAFALANNIFAMVPGQVYWINVLRDQEELLNGKRWSLTAGWNLISW